MYFYLVYSFSMTDTKKTDWTTLDEIRSQKKDVKEMPPVVRTIMVNTFVDMIKEKNKKRAFNEALNAWDDNAEKMKEHQDQIEKQKQIQQDMELNNKKNEELRMKKDAEDTLQLDIKTITDIVKINDDNITDDITDDTSNVPQVEVSE